MNKIPEFVIVELEFLKVNSYHPMLVDIPIRSIVEIIIGIPECFRDIRDEVTINELANEYYVDYKFRDNEITSKELIDRISNLVKDTLKRNIHESDKYSFYEWLDKNSVVLVKSFDWL